MSQRLLFQDLVLFSYSFDEVYLIPLFHVTTSLFIYLLVTIYLFIYLFISNCSILNIRQTCSCLILATQNIHYHHLNHLTYYSAGFLHQCIYTLQHIPEDGSFHLICIQGQLLTILLRCNTGDMNLLTLGIFLNLFSPRFQLTIGYIYLLLLYALSSASHITETQPYFRCFDGKVLTQKYLRNM